MISEVIEVNWFAWIDLILEEKFGDGPLPDADEHQRTIK